MVVTLVPLRYHLYDLNQVPLPAIGQGTTYIDVVGCTSGMYPHISSQSKKPGELISVTDFHDFFWKISTCQIGAASGNIAQV